MHSARRFSIGSRALALTLVAAAAALVPLAASPATAEGSGPVSLTALDLAVTEAGAAPTELFFSEYVEGSSNNKALEIYNGTGATVDLSDGGYNVQMFFNGSATAGLTINLTGTTIDGDVYVLAHGSASPSILAVADQANGAGWFNGDDAVVLRKGTTVIDVIGQVGFDPGAEWGSGLTSTADNTLRRKPSILGGDTTSSDAFDPAVQWDGFATDTFDGLGAHVIDAGGDSAPSVTETSPVSGAVNVALDDNVTTTFSEPVNVDGAWFSISCTSSGSHTAAVSGGPTTFTLDPDVDFVANETCTVTVFAGQVTDQDTDDPPDAMAGDATFSFTTVDTSVCGDAATFIHDIQGAGATAAQTGVRTIEGVVVGDYQDAGQFGGYFLQEEDSDADADPLTSEGIFVFNTSTAVSVGDQVRVRGTAGEFSGMTQLSSVTATAICESGVSVTPASVTLPVAAVSDLERTEGMKITVSQELTVTEVFTLARFGEVALSVGGRLETPTNAVAPGAPAIALQALNDRSRILLDDGNNQQNIDPTLHPQGGLSATNTLRVGDSVPSLTGVLDFRFSNYRVQPVGDIVFTHSNPRPLAPEPVGGNLQVAAFNVLNYFNGNGSGLDGAAGGFPTARGASTLTEFNRQRDKIISAMTQLDADVVGLMELENDVTEGSTVGAIEDLVSGLNAAAGTTKYDFIDTGVVGTDAIRVGIIYQPANVTPVGSHAIIDSTVDPRFIDTLNRPSIAQTFQLNGTRQRLTVVVNHLKSKGSDCNHVGDPDTGDGQGNCNGTRTAAAEAMVDWLATDPTGSGDPDVVVLGDLNAYAMEDPITAFKDAGYVDTIDELAGNDSYSFVFQGQSGYLDHALASPSLGAQISGVTEWHINADEPIALDYNVEFKSANQVTTFYDPGPYRSSDHDPVLVGFSLGAPPTVDAGGPYSVAEGATVTVTATGSDPDNGTLTYAWDLDNNGTFETAGQSATFSAAGIEAPASRTIAVRVTDDDGFTATDTATVDVVWNFSGFFPPIVDLPDLNAVKAGSSVAVKFSLGGDQGLSIFAAGSPSSTPIDCVTRTALGPAQQIALAGRSGLAYTASSDTYSLSWKTATNWTGCRRLSVRFTDGTVHEADFDFAR